MRSDTSESDFIFQVPVVNRGQRDIESNKSISAALDHERQFFESHPSYRSKAQYCGTPFLARKLNMVGKSYLVLVSMMLTRRSLPRFLCTMSVNLHNCQITYLGIAP